MIKKIFPILALSIFASMLGVGIISPLLPFYSETLGANDLWIGIIFASFFVSRSLVTPFISRLADRGGRKRLLAIGLLSSALISLGYIWADSPIQLAAVRLLHGVASSLIQPIAQAYIGDTAPQGEEGKWMGYYNTAFFTGFGAGPLMGGVLTDHFGLTVAFSVMGGLNLLAFLVALLLPEVRSKIAGSAQTSFREMTASPMVKGLLSYQWSFAFGRGTFSSYLPIFAGIILGLSPSLIGILLALSILLMSLLQAYGGTIADRFSRRSLAIIGSLVAAGSLALIPLSSSFWHLLVICAIGGIGGAMSMPAASALSVEEGRRFGMGSTMVIIVMAFSVGMGTGPLLAGVIADLADINWVFYCGAAVGVVGTILFAYFSRPERPVPGR